MVVVIEKPRGLHFKTVEAIMALDFQPRSPFGESGVERLVAAAGSQINIWSLSVSQEKCLLFRQTEVLQDIAKTAVAKTDPRISSFFEDEVTNDCRTRCSLVATLKDHNPQYVGCVRWSGSGVLLASCAGHCIIVFEFGGFVFDSCLPISSEGTNEGSEVNSMNGSDPLDISIEGSGAPADAGCSENGTGNPSSSLDDAYCYIEACPCEIWRPRCRMSDPESDIFDMSWFGETHLVTGGIDYIKIWDVKEKKTTQIVRYSEGFVKGVCCLSQNYIGVQSNQKRVIVWKHLKNELSIILDQTDFFQDGPSDLPYFRRGSFDPAGRYVVFPFAERSYRCFGLLFPLEAGDSFVEPDAETEKPNLPCYRFRGHQSRVNCVSFSRGVWVGTDTSSRLFTLYAQASLDGVLSVWKVFYGGQPIEAKCLLILSKRFLDEQASVVDMTWTSDGLTLAIGADDGSITLVIFECSDLDGKPCPNLKFWTKLFRKDPSLSLPATPRPPQAIALVPKPAPPSVKKAVQPKADPVSTAQPSRDPLTPQPVAKATPAAATGTTTTVRKKIAPILVSTQPSLAPPSNAFF